MTPPDHPTPAPTAAILFGDTARHASHLEALGYRVARVPRDALEADPQWLSKVFDVLGKSLDLTLVAFDDVEGGLHAAVAELVAAGLGARRSCAPSARACRIRQ